MQLSDGAPFGQALTHATAAVSAKTVMKLMLKDEDVSNTTSLKHKF
jgi:hypothetical protein